MALFSKSEVKNNLKGIFEIALFMPSGFERVEVSLQKMLRSFIWPLIIMPIALFTTVMLADEGHPYSFLLIAHSLRMLIAFGLSLFVIIVFCRHYERMEHLYQYITTANWFEVALFVLVLPIFLLLTTGMFTVDQLSNFALFVTLVSYVYTGFIITHTLRVPWEMGGFLAIAFMMISETGYDVLEFVQSQLYGV